jgi:hypothetical protein
MHLIKSLKTPYDVHFTPERLACLFVSAMTIVLINVVQMDPSGNYVGSETFSSRLSTQQKYHEGDYLLGSKAAKDFSSSFTRIRKASFSLFTASSSALCCVASSYLAVAAVDEKLGLLG